MAPVAHITLAGFLAKRNLHVAAVDHLIPLIWTSFGVSKDDRLLVTKKQCKPCSLVELEISVTIKIGKR